MFQKVNTVLLSLVLAVLIIHTIHEFREDRKGGQGAVVSAKSSSDLVRQSSPFDNPNNDPAWSDRKGLEVVNTAIEFDRKGHDFGVITDGDKVKTTFRFKNTGKYPLIIQNCFGSCGCTVPKWAHGAVEPGKSGEIEVSFDSQGKVGDVAKTVTVLANTEPEKTVLQIHAMVAPKDK